MKPGDIRSLELGQLRTFDALMRERSVSRAAARLFLSQPAVSASLSRLRETFGDPLFTRTPHGVEPTARAQAIAPQIERLLADLAALLEVPQAFEPAASNRIFRIAGSDHASRLLLPALTRQLVDAGSAIRLIWEPAGAGTAPVAERLRKGDLDLAVLARIRRPQDVESRVLYEDHYVYVLRKGHPRAGETASMDRFCEVPQVFLGYGTHAFDDLIDEALAKAGRQRLAQLAVNSFGQVVHQLCHSDHAAVIGRRVAAQYADVLVTEPLPFELPPYESLLCWDTRSDGDDGVQWLKDRVVGIMQPAVLPLNFVRLGAAL